MYNHYSVHSIEDLAPMQAKIISFEKNVSSLHFKQSYYWLRCVNSVDNLNIKIVITENDDKIMAISIITVKALVGTWGEVWRIRRGPLFRTIDALDVHIKHLIDMAGKNVMCILFSPYHAFDKKIIDIYKKRKLQNFSNQSYEYQNTVILDLTRDLADIRAKFRRSLKTQINKAIKQDISVNMSPAKSELSMFIKNYNKNARINHIEELSDSFVECILKNLNKNIIVLLAYINGRQVAGIILMRSGNSFIYEWGYKLTDTEYKYNSFPLSHLLHWNAIIKLKNMNVATYDLGGYWIKYGDGNSINRFKTGFSKKIMNLCPEYCYMNRMYITKVLLWMISLKNKLGN